MGAHPEKELAPWATLGHTPDVVTAVDYTVTPLGAHDAVQHESVGITDPAEGQGSPRASWGGEGDPWLEERGGERS